MKKLFRMMMCVLLFGLLLAGPALAADLINLNTATVEELISLPGIGPATAAKIVEYREAHPFGSVEEVMEVKGIGTAKYQTIKDKVTVGEPPAKKE
jgi:competence protein ComEA